MHTRTQRLATLVTVAALGAGGGAQHAPHVGGTKAAQVKRRVGEMHVGVITSGHRGPVPVGERTVKASDQNGVGMGVHGGAAS